MYKYIAIFEVNEKIEIYTSNSKVEFFEIMRYLVDTYYTRIHIFSPRQFERSKSKIASKARSLMKNAKCKLKMSSYKSVYKYSNDIERYRRMGIYD